MQAAGSYTVLVFRPEYAENRIAIKERIQSMKRNLLFSLTVIVVLTAALSAQGRTHRDGPASLGSEGDDAIERRLGLHQAGAKSKLRKGKYGSRKSGFSRASNGGVRLRDRCCPVIPPRKVLARLQLDESQMAEVAALAEQISAAVGPAREELRRLRAALKEQLGSEDSGPCAVGELLLEIKARPAEICAITRSFTDEFAGILNPDQLDTWGIVKDLFCDPRPHHRGPDQRGWDGDN